MAKLDLEPMSDAELGELAAAVAQGQERRQDAAQQAAVARIHELAASVGMTVAELLALQSKRRPASQGEPKYRNPDHPEQTWTGKGTRPGWFIAALERGATPEDMLI